MTPYLQMITTWMILFATSTALTTFKTEIDLHNCSKNSTYNDDNKCKTEIIIGKCLSCEPFTGFVFEGPCFFEPQTNSSFSINLKKGTICSKSLPPNSCKELTEWMCGAMNREGLLCSRCKKGYGPAPYSSTVKCFKCNNDNSSRQWFLYLTLELLPSTAFYLVVIFFNIRTTAPPYTAFVCFSQFFVFLYKIQPYIRLSLTVLVNEKVLRGIMTLIGFWNLDFLRQVVPPFCVSSSLTDLDVLLLDCLSALYPLFLAALTLVLIEFHARNFRPVVLLWKPVHKYFANCRRKLDPKSSVIAALATFMSLAFSKILFVTFLASYSRTYTINNKERRIGLYNPNIHANNTTEYLKQLVVTHYFAPLLVMFIIAQLPTLLLLLYPIKAFRRLLMCCCSSSHHAIYAFVDTFQGHYKDGTTGSRDYRAASSISFLIKTFFCAIVSSHTYRYGIPTVHQEYNSLTYLLVIISLFYGIIQPCKRKYMNIVESVVYCAAGLILLTFGTPTNYKGDHSHVSSSKYLVYASLALLVLPSIMMIALSTFKIVLCSNCIRMTFIESLLKLFKRFFKQDRIFQDMLPHRLEHPLEYEPLN